MVRVLIVSALCLLALSELAMAGVILPP